jgi:lipoyl(octanoyl) transferase
VAAIAFEVQMRDLGVVDYLQVWEAMKAFNEARTADTRDEVWWVQHPPVYTQGLNCDMSTLTASDIPVVATDRGGQITYHGPGQLIVYPLLDIKRRAKGIKWLVNLLEQLIIDFLAIHDIQGERRTRAPGVYVRGEKIAALGLRVRRGASYHGLSFNVDMDLAPFANIDPCGFEDLEVTQLRDLGVPLSIGEVQDRLSSQLRALLAGSE